ncbi:MAG TPA: hypothetical protein VEB18_01930 [Candidatus Paceibacterota bacterium]|nr:hypothetical protein [Candidatus Paceibacterota bacterium]
MNALLKNSYFLGFAMLVIELVVNSVFGSTVISGIVLSFIVGMVYAVVHKTKMPAIERLKVLSVYIGIIALIVVFLAFAQYPAMLGIALGLGALFLGAYALFMYFGMWFGSWTQVKAQEKRAKKLAEKAVAPTPPAV